MQLFQMEFIRTDYSLLELTKEDVFQLKIIGDLYIGNLRFHAINDCLYNDEQELVGKIQNNSIIWIEI
jgi:hypothetical protein